jgi:hypothetical protein
LHHQTAHAQVLSGGTKCLEQQKMLCEVATSTLNLGTICMPAAQVAEPNRTAARLPRSGLGSPTGWRQNLCQNLVFARSCICNITSTTYARDTSALGKRQRLDCISLLNYIYLSFTRRPLQYTPVLITHSLATVYLVFSMLRRWLQRKDYSTERHRE